VSSRFQAVGEESITTKAIATAIGEQLGLPVKSIGRPGHRQERDCGRPGRAGDSGLGSGCLFRGPRRDGSVSGTVGRRRYEIIMIGAGLRLEPSMTPLFETVVNLVLKHSLRSTLCLNTGPGSTEEAVRRWWPAPS
jgi:hypothetical protein